ncbi:hypothetical protein OAC57_05685 [Planktomarina temperata]|nr:hypothetical protein [Planktomarina temperata]
MREMREPRKIFEIGLGTNNVDIVSAMGTEGKPGASPRAFRDFWPEAQLIGADFDARILFSEDRIETYFVDQTKPKTSKIYWKIMGPTMISCLTMVSMHLLQICTRFISFCQI